MSGLEDCIRCGRRIDGQARICPYCNWDQTMPVPAQHAANAPEAQPYVPPPEHRWRKQVMGAIGILIAVLISGLAIAERLRKTVPQAAPSTEQQIQQMKLQQKVEAPPPKPSQRANVTLVMDNSPSPSLDQPITSAPATTTAQGLATAYQRTDATAASSSEYSQMAQRAQAEKKTESVLIDPRSLTGQAYQQGASRRQQSVSSDSMRTDRMQPQVNHTSAVPEYQPVPALRISRDATARLELSVGADGRVKSVNVRDSIPTDMGRLIESVRSWRFKPATLNGVPVPSAFSVELSFHASE
jgi:outer membrane biosynthesis protein TonB